MEVADDQISDEAALDAALDAALEDQSVMTGSESEISNNDQVISIVVGQCRHSVCWRQYRHCQTMSILGNNPFYSMGWIKVTFPAPPLQDPQTTEAVLRVKLKALGKVTLKLRS